MRIPYLEIIKDRKSGVTRFYPLKNLSMAR